MYDDDYTDESAAVYKVVADAIFTVLAAISGAFVAALILFYVAVL